MKLPNADRAIVDIRKLEEYCLNPHHFRGRNKARVFAAVGITLKEAEALRLALLAAAANQDAMPGPSDHHGQRYVVDFNFIREGPMVMIRSSWIVRADEGVPRLTSCYVI